MAHLYYGLVYVISTSMIVYGTTQYAWKRPYARINRNITGCKY